MIRVAPLSTGDCCGPAGECCTSAAHRRTGISFCVRTWLAHIYSFNFKVVVTVQIISLDSFDFVVGLDMIKTYKMELLHDPFCVMTISYSNLRSPSNVSRTPRRVNLPICINSLKDDAGHDDNHYLCDVQNFGSNVSKSLLLRGRLLF